MLTRNFCFFNLNLSIALRDECFDRSYSGYGTGGGKIGGKLYDKRCDR